MFSDWYKLILKVDIPIILLRNFNPTKRLCNSTKLIEIITGTYLGQRVYGSIARKIKVWELFGQNLGVIVF